MMVYLALGNSLHPEEYVIQVSDDDIKVNLSIIS